MPPAPLEPTPPSPREDALRRGITRKARSPLVQWTLRTGWKVLVPVVVCVVVAGAIVGPVGALDYLAGVRAPSSETVMSVAYFAAATLTVVGWLAVPALVGSVVGYVVSTQLGAFRSKSRSDIEGDGG